MEVDNLKSPFMLQYHAEKGTLYIFTSVAKKKETESLDFAQVQYWCKYNIDQKIADIYVFTDDNVFRSQIRVTNLNNDLTWNQKSIRLLFEVLNGKRHSTNIKYNNQQNKLRLSCELDGGIAVRFLQIKLFLLDTPPFQYMSRLLENQKQQIEEKERAVNQQCESLAKDIKQLDAQERKMVDDHYFDMQQRKNLFLPIVNKVKGRIKKKSNNAIIQETEERNQNIANRRILKIDRKSQPKEKSINDQLLDLF